MFEHIKHMNIYLRKVASEGINHHVEHCIFLPASRVLFSSRCPTFRVSLLSSFGTNAEAAFRLQMLSGELTGWPGLHWKNQTPIVTGITGKHLQSAGKHRWLLERKAERSKQS